MTVFLDVARPWAPFVVGLGFGFGITTSVLISTAWHRRHNARRPWKYDSEIAKAYDNFKQTDWRWSVILGGPVVLGVILWVVWVLLSLAAGGSA